jgi:hypothetical protein
MPFLPSCQCRCLGIVASQSPFARSFCRRAPATSRSSTTAAPSPTRSRYSRSLAASTPPSGPTRQRRSALAGAGPRTPPEASPATSACGPAPASGTSTTPTRQVGFGKQEYRGAAAFPRSRQGSNGKVSQDEVKQLSCLSPCFVCRGRDNPGAATPVELIGSTLERVRLSEAMVPPMRFFISIDEGDVMRQAEASASRWAAGR